jgi:hypothetical protein
MIYRFFFNFSSDDIDAYLFDILFNFAARRNLERERGLEKVEIAFGNPLVLDLRLPEMPLKVSLNPSRFLYTALSIYCAILMDLGFFNCYCYYKL